MTKPTREQVLELADSYRLQSQGAKQGARDTADSELRAIWQRKSDECATIALALRLYAETMGREAEPAGGIYGEFTPIKTGCSTASPPPAPGYAEGLEVAAKLAEEMGKNNVGMLHPINRAEAAAIRALKKGAPDA